VAGGSPARLGLISDTHGRLRPEVLTHFDGVDRILHAGDIGPPGILDDLGMLAPVVAVWGNTDGFDIRHLVPEVADQTIEGRRIVVTHGHQLGSPRPDALRAAHPQADVIVYGHTHRPLIDRDGGALVINPGSAGDARFGLRPTLAILTLREQGKEAEVELVEL
jgi:uncharacterized protein